MPLPQQISTDLPETGANDALATVADAPAHKDFASAFGDAFLYQPDAPDVPEAFPAEQNDAPVALPYLELPYLEPSSPVEPAAAPAAKKPRRSRSKSKTAEPTAAETPKAEAMNADAPAKAKRGDRRKKVSAESDDTPGAPPKPRRRKTDAPKMAQPEAAQPEAVQPEAALLESDAPAPEPDVPTTAPAESWVDLVLESTPSTRTTDQWVDQVLEPSKAPLPRPRPAAARVAKARVAQGRAAQPRVATPAPPIVKKANAPTSRPAASAAPAGTRWWLVALAFVLIGGLAIANRPGGPHAPLPTGVLGVWTTEFWKYEKQTLELLPDTVVLTLDGPEERRYPITRVETAPAGAETAVKISYRLRTGDEKELDFLADQNPTTALRFRAHSGLVWTRPEE